MADDASQRSVSPRRQDALAPDPAPSAPPARLGPPHITSDPHDSQRPESGRPEHTAHMRSRSNGVHPAHTETGGMTLGTSLGPVLEGVCAGQLGAINWFRTAWQQGGAATGFSTWTTDDGVVHPAMVKLPVPPLEYRWTKRLGGCVGGPTPRVYAASDELGAYHFAWLVVEKFPGHPVSSNLCEASLRAMLRAAARFYRDTAAIESPLGLAPKDPPDWGGLLEKGRKALTDAPIEHNERWLAMLDRVEPELDALAAKWAGRAVTCWCHGDLHPHNAMHRACEGEAGAGDGGSGPDAALIDLALVHPGSWIEDALYLERLFWGHEDKLFGVRPLEDLAREREALGLPTAAECHELADIRRVLMASSVPAFLGREGSPKYVVAALERLEGLVGRVLG